MYRGSSSNHPSIVPSVGRVVERVCAEARERTARWSVRASARVDGSIDIFSMHRVSSSAFACVGRIGRVGRMRGWLDGWEKPRALWTGAAARLCERGSILCFFLAGREPWICERVNTHPNNAEGSGSGSSGSGSGERSGWMERWMKRG